MKPRPDLSAASYLPSSQGDQWFVQEVQPHDAQLKTYLRGTFPTVRDVDDIVQESYLRLWKARARTPIQSAKAFLFQIARHLALDHIRRGKISPFEETLDLKALPTEPLSPPAFEQLATEDKFRLLADAISELPPRGRAVILLCKVKGLSHREAALQLGVSEATINEHILRGIKRLGKILRSRGFDHHF